MFHYMSNPVKDVNKVEKWRRFATLTLERFPPGFMMVIFLLVLYRGLDAGTQIPAVDWINERFGITADVWKTVFLIAAGGLAYFRPSPKYTLLLSLPAAILGGGLLWYGVAAQRDVIALIFIFFCWFTIGLAMVLMVLYQEQLITNEALAKANDDLKKEQNYAATTPPRA